MSIPLPLLGLIDAAGGQFAPAGSGAWYCKRRQLLRELPALAARLLEELTTTGELGVQIELALGSAVTEQTFDDAKILLAQHPGAAPVILRVGGNNGERAPRLRSKSLRVSPDAETMEELQKLFGHGSVRVVRMFSPAPQDTPVRGKPEWLGT